MRGHAIVAPTFWTGETGRKIRAAGRDALLIANHLMTGPMSNMIGLYHLPLATLAHYTASPLEGASEALRSLQEVGFAYYDEEEEIVWVPEMAVFQVGRELKLGDNRIKAVEREALTYCKSRFYAAFLDRYKEPFHLDPQKPLRSQEQEQEQD